MSITESKVKEPIANEQRIRELAYQIWETEGCPDGQASRHWELAYKLAAIEARPEPAPAKRNRPLSKPHEADITSVEKAAGYANAAESGAADIVLPQATRKPRAAKTSSVRKPDAATAASKLRDTTTTDT